MGRVGMAVGIVGVVALAGAAAYATSLVETAQLTEGRNPAPPTERVRVEVLNAGGVSGQARAATVRLRDIGFDVVSYGNAGRFDRDSSVVVDRVGRPELARAVADILGVSLVNTDLDANLFVDVTVLLGRDWQGGAALDGIGADAPEREPWDPRGWIGR
ncbi:MAG: LytR C-terminal domain-containing protein [Gemmatimonadota bacterium]|nr:LytR C-terminal domain-containing protein [Gemmatimonadota bacterium]MDH3421437.1 LytR C-terminal domain-containing protein [Gemmatimonadota bacterium]